MSNARLHTNSRECATIAARSWVTCRPTCCMQCAIRKSPLNSANLSIRSGHAKKGRRVVINKDQAWQLLREAELVHDEDTVNRAVRRLAIDITAKLGDSLP